MLARSKLFVTAVAATVFALTGCTLPSAMLAAEQPATQLWSTSMRTLGSVAVADGVAVAYVSPREGKLELRAWSIDDGTPLWQAEASPGSVSMGIAIRPAVLEADGVGYVAYARQTEWGNQHVVLAAIADGEPVAYEGSDLELLVKERPGPCTSDEQTGVPERLCFAAVTEDSGTSVLQFALDADGREQLDDAAVGSERQRLVSNLYATGAREDGTERLEYLTDGKVQWSVPYEDIFGAGFSPVFGWRWQQHDESQLLIGTGSSGWEEGSDASLKNTTVALSPDDGAVLWRQPGVSLLCDIARATNDVGCRYSETVFEVPPDEPDALRIADGTMDIVRLNLATGEELWRVPVGAWAGAESFDEGFARNAAEAIIVQEGNPVLLSFETGQTEPLNWGAYPCGATSHYLYPSWADSDAEDTRYAGLSSYFGCDADGNETPEAELGAAAVRLAGTRVDESHGLTPTEAEHWLMTTKTGMTMYALPPQ